jgi:hypothetical protein
MLKVLGIKPTFIKYHWPVISSGGVRGVGLRGAGLISGDLERRGRV